MIIGSDTLASWERFYRANFINSLSGFKSVSLIGTINNQGQPNLGVFSNVVHLGADPALIGYINRPLEAAPHTLANIKATGIYTINHIQESFVAQAHQCSAKYPPDINEFEATGLHAEFIEDIAVPFVKESNTKYALSLQEIIPIALNNTYLVIGKVELVVIDETTLQEDGFLDLDKAGSLCSSGLDSYHTTHSIARFRYAKPGVAPQKLR